MSLLSQLLVHAQGARRPHHVPVRRLAHLGCLFGPHLGRHHGQPGRRPRPASVAMAFPDRGRHHGRGGHCRRLCAAQLSADDAVADGAGGGHGGLATGARHWRGRLGHQRRADILPGLHGRGQGRQDVGFGKSTRTTATRVSFWISRLTGRRQARHPVWQCLCGFHYQLLSQCCRDTQILQGQDAAPHRAAVCAGRLDHASQRVARRQDGREILARIPTALSCHGNVHHCGMHNQRGGAIC